MDDWGGIIGIIFMLAAIIFVIYCIVVIASVLAVIAGGAGVLWGGGTAVVNYGKSFKENMIDSNISAA